MKFWQQVVAVSALQSMSVCTNVKAGGEQRPCYQMGEEIYSFH